MEIMAGSDEIETPNSRQTVDPVSVVKEINKLVTVIKRNDQKQKLNEINEMKQLRFLICDHNPVRSVTACQGLMSLVEDDVLQPMHAISLLVSAFANIQNYSGVTAALAVLLRWDMDSRPKPYECPFSLYPIQHPLITLLKHKRDTWSDVYRLVQNFFFHSEKRIEEENILVLRPLLLYVLCDPQSTPHLPAESRQKTWALLLHFLEDLSVRQLVFQCVPWFQIADESRCVEAGMLLLDLCESALREHDGPLCMALAPIAAASIRNLVTRGADPEPCLAIVIRLLSVSSNGASCVMLLLADTITVCPATFLASIIKSCKEIFNLHACSRVSVYAVVTSLLPWLAFPSVLTRGALQLATKFLVEIRDSPASCWSNTASSLCANPWFRLLRHSFENVHEAAELCRVNESWRSETEANKWIDLVKTSCPTFIARFSPYFCSLLISNSFSDVKDEDDSVEWPALSSLVWLANNQASVSGRITLTLLYQLAQEKRPLQQLALFRAISVMGKYEENMVLILGVLKSLMVGGFYSSTLALDLFVRVWKVQPRAYRFLHDLLTTPFKGDNQDLLWESNIAKAAAINEICSTSPDAHGSELVPLLSQILTQNASPEGSVASSLAVQGITSLCRAGIMDVASTWRGLAPKLMQDKRPGVIVSLCELLSVVSCLSTTTGKYEEFIADVIVTLWSWAQHANSEVACAALKSLSEFHMDQITLKSLPAAFRQNLKLPSAFCKTPIDAKRDPVEVLPYVPGDCWKQVLESLGSHEDRRAAVCSMLTSWMRNEIKLFHRGLYNQSPSKPEPTSYEHLHDSSILRAMFSVAYQAKYSLKLSALALTVLAKDLPRPLPPVTWNFIEEKLKEGGTVRKNCLEILAKQCKSSQSANRILLATLSSLSLPDDVEDCKTIFTVLNYLGQGIPPNHLGPFVDRCLAHAVDEMKSDTLLKTYLGHMKVALRSQDLHESNVATLANIIEKLVEKINLSDKVFDSFEECALVLPSKNVERLISPSLWWEVSLKKVLCAIRVSSAIAMAQDSDMPLAALNDTIDICADGDLKAQECLLESVMRVVRVCRDHESNSRWLLQLLGRIQAIKANKDTENEKKSKMLLSVCDLLLVTVISLAGHDILAGDPKIIASSSQDRHLLFPQALWALLNTNSTWKNLSSQVIEWLYDMSIAAEVPSLLAQTFRLAITPLRYQQHFKKTTVWMRILSS
ncbi:focadhesin isoform X2 [Frankliniella occidentalis]|uniref:Focadhesin isoform X2 n=1 Tax=Frankliniella occidentalis TaxID=133901 RepID=A0A6J1TCC4_FRAOC|nr:focadhesin isoform X2 [Frankliniella occidentalis]